MDGGSGADTLLGGSENDSILGDIGNDTIDGGLGADVVGAGAGRNVIRVGAGEGVDNLSGGSGSDRFEFVDGFGTSTIADFAKSVDLIDLSGLIGVTQFADLPITYITETVINAGVDQITLLGVTGGLAETDFQF